MVRQSLVATFLFVLYLIIEGTKMVTVFDTSMDLKKEDYVNSVIYLPTTESVVVKSNEDTKKIRLTREQRSWLNEMCDFDRF